MDEWEYLEGHEDLYKDAMMEDHWPLTLQGGSLRRNPPGKCPRPLYSQDCAEEKAPENPQDENLIDVKLEFKDEAEEETNLWADQQFGLIERNPPERCPRPLCSQDCPEEKPTENHQVEGAEPCRHLYRGS
ncbi:uncharacterized protein LOC120994248 isoform X2 [Bufo bufo]|uniref:uncharacterized protein LOC120994248 isoform X2 n=1 Tax=Bufo bufo TaxID=8384 RepID=UPI001ABDC810|nr:uncharacterized protein LOC120994248 isoform X2 [Bufo bufo]